MPSSTRFTFHSGRGLVRPWQPHPLHAPLSATPASAASALGGPAAVSGGLAKRAGEQGRSRSGGEAKPFKMEDYLLTPEIVRVRHSLGALVLRRG